MPDMKANIKSQYLASLDMLRQAVTKCPEPLWNDSSFRNVFWRVACHTLFYTHFYLYPGPDSFQPWAKQRPEMNRMDTACEPYSKADILEYCDLCCSEVEKMVDAVDLDAPSGFHWLPFNRLETHLYNIRHLHHHTGELCERLGVNAEINVDWVISVTAGGLGSART